MKILFFLFYLFPSVVLASGLGFNDTSNPPLTGNSGNVGLGSATPGTRLDVNGTIRSISGGFTFPDGSKMASAEAVNAQSTPANPTGSANTTGLMMGLAGSITPVRSGNILIIISGYMKNNTANDGSKVQIRYGTGAAPANGDALTGTAVGGSVQQVSSNTTNTFPFSVNAIVSNLTLSTAYWIDVSLAAITGGTSNIFSVSISAVEI